MKLISSFAVFQTRSLRSSIFQTLIALRAPALSLSLYQWFHRTFVCLVSVHLLRNAFFRPLAENRWLHAEQRRVGAVEKLSSRQCVREKIKLTCVCVHLHQIILLYRGENSRWTRLRYLLTVAEENKNRRQTKRYTRASSRCLLLPARSPSADKLNSDRKSVSLVLASPRGNWIITADD